MTIEEGFEPRFTIDSRRRGSSHSWARASRTSRRRRPPRWPLIVSVLVAPVPLIATRWSRRRSLRLHAGPRVWLVEQCSGTVLDDLCSSLGSALRSCNERRSSHRGEARAREHSSVSDGCRVHVGCLRPPLGDHDPDDDWIRFPVSLSRRMPDRRTSPSLCRGRGRRTGRRPKALRRGAEPALGHTRSRPDPKPAARSDDQLQVGAGRFQGRRRPSFQLLSNAPECTSTGPSARMIKAAPLLLPSRAWVESFRSPWTAWAALVGIDLATRAS